jgi:DNA gyrase/topoisomerase IV subunit A
MERELKIKRARLEVVEGLLIAIQNHEVFNEIISERDNALQNLIVTLSLTDLQARSLLDLKMPPEKIEKERIIEEKNRLQRTIKKLESKLSSNGT